ncbi:MAG: hypothetical protein IJ890_00250 [Clostridia bacterium]|nr:hypothetical protein [Clostridia bacterium]
MKLCIDVWYTKDMDDIVKIFEWKKKLITSYDNIVKKYDGEIIASDSYNGLVIISWEYQIEDNLYQLIRKISECVEIIFPELTFFKQEVITLKDSDMIIFSEDYSDYTIYIRTEERNGKE